MAVLQQKVCITAVIEAGIVPVTRVVTIAALLAAATIMGIIFTVTAEARGLGIQEGAVCVTIKARRLLVFAQQRIAGCFVVKLCITPRSWLMTGGAVIAHGLLMRCFILMARHTFGHCIAMLSRRLMATIAIGFKVFADQLEVRERVVESCCIQNDHVGIPAFVLRVTFAALLGFRVRVFAVEAGRCLNIGRDRLVAIHAEISLRAFVKHLVTGAALRFYVCVICNHLARHDERLNILCTGIGDGKDCKHCQCHRECPLPAMHVVRQQISVHVYSKYMNQRRYHHQDEQGHVKQMPQREHALIE